jgi:large subunit ribosomal protein L18
MSGHNLGLKRRRAGQTDYALRTKLLRSKIPQLVVRCSNRYMYAQVIRAEAAGDKVLTSASGKELAKFDWRLGSASIPASYLVGYLVGLRALELGITSAILNMGLSTPTRGNKAFAVVSGAVEAGLDVPRKEDVLPPKDRLHGRHVAAYIMKVRENPADTRSQQFSKITGEGTEVDAEVQKVRESIKRAVPKGSG